ncbi:uncharacterized protein [Clytia hemisphaerica]|uniref:Uncharacterized protein n=1 Tax=Clytia hemisphaerica TaxID=252671 RepID=A0A7M5V551_9CNID
MNPTLAENSIYKKSDYIDQCIQTMKDLSKVQPARRKRKHTAESWTAKYKQLEIFILKDLKKEEIRSSIKKETAITKPSKKRKAATEISLLANAAFPDDLDVSFYHGEMSDVSFSLNTTTNDHVVPDTSSAKLSTFCNDVEDPLISEEQDIKDKCFGKVKTPSNYVSKLPSLKGNQSISFNRQTLHSNILKTPVIQKPHYLTKEQFTSPACVSIPKIQKLVPQTPSIPPRTPYLGSNHRQNSGFSVPETPALLPNNRVTIVKETPMIMQHR